MSTDTNKVQSKLERFDFANVRLMKWINSQLVAIVTTKYIYIWQIGSKYTQSMHGLTGSITDLSVSHNKKYFLLVSDSGSVLVHYRGDTPERKIINAYSGAFAKYGSNVVFVKAECGKNDNNVNTITIHAEEVRGGELGPSLWSTTFTVLEDSTSHLPIYLYCHDGVGFVVTSDSIYIVNLATRGVLAAQKVTVGNESIKRATGAGGTIYVITTKRRILHITIAEDREDTDSGKRISPLVTREERGDVDSVNSGTDEPPPTPAVATPGIDPPGASPPPLNVTPLPAEIAQEEEDVDGNLEQEGNEGEEEEEEGDEEEADDDDGSLTTIAQYVLSHLVEEEQYEVHDIARNLAVPNEKVIIFVCDVLVALGMMEWMGTAESISASESRPRRIASNKIRTLKEPSRRDKLRRGHGPHFHFDEDNDVRETRETRAFFWRGESGLPGFLYQLQTTNTLTGICQLLLKLFLSNGQLEFPLSDVTKHLMDQLQVDGTSDEMKRRVLKVVRVLEAAQIIEEVVGTASLSLEQHSLRWKYYLTPSDIHNIGIGSYNDDVEQVEERNLPLEPEELGSVLEDGEEEQQRVGVDPEPESHRPDPEAANELPPNPAQAPAPVPAPVVIEIIEGTGTSLDGWTKETHQRQNRRKDHYYYSPVTRKKFRSRKGAETFVSILGEDGVEDEEQAFVLFRSRGHKN